MSRTPSRRTPSRRNPLTFDNRFEVTPEVRESIRVDRDRAKASILSPAKQRAIEQATVDSPHNFRVVLGGSRKDAYLAGAVTLLVGDRPLLSALSLDSATNKSNRMSLFTAFTYLHRFGDRVLVDLSISYGGKGLYFLEEQVLHLLRNALLTAREGEIHLGSPEVMTVARLLQPCRDAYAEANEALQQQGSTPSTAGELVNRYVNTHVNSKMVREGYSVNHSQALADLFPLCELTPPSRPLFLPFDAQRMGRETFWKVSAQQTETLTEYGEAMNVRFRAFYNTLVPTLYGGVMVIL